MRIDDTEDEIHDTDALYEQGATRPEHGATDLKHDNGRKMRMKLTRRGG
jgi:hypothetical protein